MSDRDDVEGESIAFLSVSLAFFRSTRAYLLVSSPSHSRVYTVDHLWPRQGNSRASSPKTSVTHARKSLTRTPLRGVLPLLSSRSSCSSLDADQLSSIPTPVLTLSTPSASFPYISRVSDNPNLSLPRPSPPPSASLRLFTQPSNPAPSAHHSDPLRNLLAIPLPIASPAPTPTSPYLCRRPSTQTVTSTWIPSPRQRSAGCQDKQRDGGERHVAALRRPVAEQEEDKKGKTRLDASERRGTRSLGSLLHARLARAPIYFDDLNEANLSLQTPLYPLPFRLVKNFLRNGRGFSVLGSPAPPSH